MAFLQNYGLLPKCHQHRSLLRRPYSNDSRLARVVTPPFQRRAGGVGNEERPPCRATPFKCPGFFNTMHTIQVRHRGADNVGNYDSSPYYVGILVQTLPGRFECTTDGETRGAKMLLPRYMTTLRYCKKLVYPALTKLVYWKEPVLNTAPEYKTRELVPNQTYEIP